MVFGVYIWRIVSCGAHGWDTEVGADGAAGRCPRSCAVIAGVCWRGRLEGDVTVDGGLRRLWRGLWLAAKVQDSETAAERYVMEGAPGASNDVRHRKYRRKWRAANMRGV